MAWAVAGALGSVRVHHDVAELSRRALGAAVDLAVQQQPTADAGAERDQHGVVDPAGGAGTMLGEDGHVRVVVHPDGQPEALAHQVAKRQAVERQVVRDHYGAGAGPHQRGDPEAHDGRVGRHRARLLDGVQEGVEQLSLIEPEDPPVHPMMHRQRLVHDAAEQLGATSVDTDDAPRRHARTLYTTW